MQLKFWWLALRYWLAYRSVSRGNLAVIRVAEILAKTNPQHASALLLNHHVTMQNYHAHALSAFTRAPGVEVKPPEAPKAKTVTYPDGGSLTDYSALPSVAALMKLATPSVMSEAQERREH